MSPRGQVSRNSLLSEPLRRQRQAELGVHEPAGGVSPDELLALCTQTYILPRLLPIHFPKTHFVLTVEYRATTSLDICLIIRVILISCNLQEEPRAQHVRDFTPHPILPPLQPQTL
ncbi:unnamed protein product [Pleuronectes platessa]|uniref:Uncharacterized protein n=1 Tax=Pleuronectes platessa TaxID=8262 RepID=A0A9N7VE67_PLEPL|nr:unnamed protein product [Pleuronectes platessa]